MEDKDKNEMKGSIVSAILGATFFAVPYIAFGLPILPALGIGVTAFGAGNLLFSDNNNNLDMRVKVENTDDMSFKKIISEAKWQNSEIYAIIDKLDDPKLRFNLRELHDTASKIINAVAKNPQKYEQAKSFFGYYLPVTVKILKNYDDIENQRLDYKEFQKFMDKTENMIDKINQSFKKQLASLYQSNIVDADAEMKVFNSLLNSEGLTDNDDFNLK